MMYKPVSLKTLDEQDKTLLGTKSPFPPESLPGLCE